MFIDDDCVLAAQALQRDREPRQVRFMETARWFIEQHAQTALSRIEDASQPYATALAFAHIEHAAISRQVAEAYGDNRMCVPPERLNERPCALVYRRREGRSIPGERLDIRECHCEAVGDALAVHPQRPCLARPPRSSALLACADFNVCRQLVRDLCSSSRLLEDDLPETREQPSGAELAALAVAIEDELVAAAIHDQLPSRGRKLRPAHVRREAAHAAEALDRFVLNVQVLVVLLRPESE